MMSDQQIEQLARAVRNLDSRLRDVANFKPALQAWQTLTLINSWAAFDTPTYGTPAYWKDPHGIVHLRGAITTGTLNTVAFTLPADYRSQTFAVMLTSDVNGTAAAHIIDPNGDVTPFTGTSPLLLFGLSWRAYQ